MAALGLVALKSALILALSGDRGTPVREGADTALLAELRAQRELQQRPLDALERLGEQLALARVAPASGERRAAGRAHEPRRRPHRDRPGPGPDRLLCPWPRPSPP